MPIVTALHDYDGFKKKVARLGLQTLVEEALSTLHGWPLLVEEKREANGTRWLRRRIDQAFRELHDWRKISSGGVDWSKQLSAGGSIAVEVQVSARSDLLAVDVLHLADDLRKGHIDIGIIIVPDDELSRFLTDRTPNLRTAIRHVERAKDQPILIAAFKHDGVGPALDKAVTNLGRRSRQ